MREKFETIHVLEEIQKEIKENWKNEEIYGSSYYRKILDILQNEEQIIIVGAGVYGRMLIDDMMCNNITGIVGIADNNLDLHGKDYRGYQIFSLENAVNNFPQARYIVTPKGYWNTLMYQLADLKIDTRQIIIFDMHLSGLEI